MTTFSRNHERPQADTTTFCKRSDRSDLLINNMLDRCPVAKHWMLECRFSRDSFRAPGTGPAPLKTHADDMPGLPPPAPSRPRSASSYLRSARCRR